MTVGIGGPWPDNTWILDFRFTILDRQLRIQSRKFGRPLGESNFESGESKPWLSRGSLNMPRSFREAYAAARSEALRGATYPIQSIRCQRAYTLFANEPARCIAI